MALANVAALLARWGHRVLALDWDLEAPGLERYFVGENGRSPEVDPQRPGMLELLLSVSDEDRRPWRECVQSTETEPNVEPISLITAGGGTKITTSGFKALISNECSKSKAWESISIN